MITGIMKYKIILIIPRHCFCFIVSDVLFYVVLATLIWRLTANLSFIKNVKLRPTYYCILCWLFPMSWCPTMSLHTPSTIVVGGINIHFTINRIMFVSVGTARDWRLNFTLSVYQINFIFVHQEIANPCQ